MISPCHSRNAESQAKALKGGQATGLATSKGTGAAVAGALTEGGGNATR